MAASYRWKSFEENEDRPEKPRRYGVTEMRGPRYSVLSQNVLQEIFESMGQFVDGLKFSGGSNSLIPKSFIKQAIEMAHEHDVYVSTGDWAEHTLRSGGPSAFKEYVKAERCLEAGADTIMIDPDDVCKYADSLRADIIAKVIGRLGIEKTMFEASDAKLAECDKSSERVTHRLEELKYADGAVYMEKGRVVKHGDASTIFDFIKLKQSSYIDQISF